MRTRPGGTLPHSCLHRRGYNIGVRLIEDFLARTQQGRCYDLKETADILAKVCPPVSPCVCVVTTACVHLQVGFKTFLGVTPTVAHWNQKNDEFSLILEQNPLTDFVELPEDHPQLLYSNILTGVIRGALEMVSSRGASEKSYKQCFCLICFLQSFGEITVSSNFNKPKAIVQGFFWGGSGKKC